MEKVILNTAGNGWWSKSEKQVHITNIQLDYIDDEFGDGHKDKAPKYGNLKVFFDTKTWNTDKDGLIYTDSKFLKEIRAFFDKHGLPGKDVDYTEQGMQGDNYVSMSVGKAFLKAWGEKFNIDWNEQLKSQEEKIQKEHEKMLSKIYGKKMKP